MSLYKENKFKTANPMMPKQIKLVKPSMYSAKLRTISSYLREKKINTQTLYISTSHATAIMLFNVYVLRILNRNLDLRFMTKFKQLGILTLGT